MASYDFCIIKSGIYNYNLFLYRNPLAKAMITTGNGRFYSNGVDLSWVAEMARTNREAFDDFYRHKMRAIPYRLLTFPIPTLALVNGEHYNLQGDS